MPRPIAAAATSEAMQWSQLALLTVSCWLSVSINVALLYCQHQAAQLLHSSALSQYLGSEEEAMMGGFVSKT